MALLTGISVGRHDGDIRLTVQENNPENTWMGMAALADQALHMAYACILSLEGSIESTYQRAYGRFYRRFCRGFYQQLKALVGRIV